MTSQGGVNAKTKAFHGHLRAVMEEVLTRIGDLFLHIRKRFDEQEASD